MGKEDSNDLEIPHLRMTVQNSQAMRTRVNLKVIIIKAMALVASEGEDCSTEVKTTCKSNRIRNYLRFMPPSLGQARNTDMILRTRDTHSIGLNRVGGSKRRTK